MKILTPYKSRKNPRFLVITLHPVSWGMALRDLLLVMVPVLLLLTGGFALAKHHANKIQEGKQLDARIDAMLDAPFKPIITVYGDTLNLYPMDCPPDNAYAPDPL